MKNDYFSRQITTMAPHRAILRAVECRLMSQVPWEPLVLDVGCGDGHFASIAYDQLVDVGVDVPSKVFVETAIHEDAEIIAISVSMRETVPLLKKVVDLKELKGISGKVKILIGGQAVSERTCEEFGVDAYGKDAREGVEKAEALLSV